MRAVTILLLLLLGASSNAQIRWLDPLHQDLGVVQRQEEYTLLFRFVNEGEQPVWLDNVRTDCGCTAPDWSRDPVLPGGESVIELHFRPPSKGRYRKKARVWFRSQGKPILLSLEAVAR